MDVPHCLRMGLVTRKNKQLEDGNFQLQPLTPKKGKVGMEITLDKYF